MKTLDLSVNLKEAATRSESLKQLSASVIARHVAAYECFLELIRRHGGPVAPTREIDQIWHLHMLHPVAYHADCMRLFGRILDHDGGFGSAPEERPILGQVFARTAKLWHAAFRVSYVACYEGTSSEPSLENCWHDCQNRCWHACSSKVDAGAGAIEARP